MTAFHPFYLAVLSLTSFSVVGLAGCRTVSLGNTDCDYCSAEALEPIECLVQAEEVSGVDKANDVPTPSFDGTEECRDHQRSEHLQPTPSVHLGPAEDISEIDEAYEVQAASFEGAEVSRGHQPGGYLRHAPNFPASGPGAWWAEHRDELDMLKSKNEELVGKNERLLEETRSLQQELLQTRKVVLESLAECEVAKRELTEAREELLTWRRETETTLRDYQRSEDQHLAELDRIIAMVQVVLRQKQTSETASSENSLRPVP